MAVPVVSIVVQPPRPATELRWLVDDAIAPWRAETGEPPPFSPGELFIMALAQHDRPLTRKEVFFWIYETFDYYHKLGMPHLWYLLETRESDREMARRNWYVGQMLDPKSSFGPKLLDVVLDYNLPLRATSGKLRIEDKSTWSVDAREALFMLKSRLRPFKREGVFPFLRLPAEIRNCIYEMLFRYPRSGVRINRDGIDRSGKVYMRTRDPDVDLSSYLERHPVSPHGFCWQYPLRGCHPLLEAGKLSNILGQMLVSRQFHAEARSIFYSTNVFAFDSASHLRGVLRKMPPESRNRVERMTFDYKGEIVRYVALRDAFAIVATMESLKWLQISLLESNWMAEDWHGDPCIEDRLQFNRAARIGEHVQVVLRGDYPDTIESQIRSDPIVDESEDEEDSEDEQDSADPTNDSVSESGKKWSVKRILSNLTSGFGIKSTRLRLCKRGRRSHQKTVDGFGPPHSKLPQGA